MSQDEQSKTQLPVASASTALLTATDIIAPIDIDKAAQAFHKFDQFKKRILNAHDVVNIQGKLYLKRSAWSKWALVCNVSDRLVSYERVPIDGRDAEGGFYYRVVWEAFHQPTGRSSVGTGIVSSREKKSWAHEEHDIWATACTRARNRAISSLVGGGEVSAEEMTSDDTSTPPTPVDTTQTSSWHVPSTKDLVTREGLKQYPLGYGNKTVGAINLDEINLEVAFVPDARVKVDSSPIKSFLVGRIFSSMKEKHGVNFDHYLDVDAEGILRAVLVKPPDIEPERVKELANACGWAFQKSSESKT